MYWIICSCCFLMPVLFIISQVKDRSQFCNKSL
jgi:hypothetical protein